MANEKSKSEPAGKMGQHYSVGAKIPRDDAHSHPTHVAPKGADLEPGKPPVHKDLPAPGKVPSGRDAINKGKKG